LIPQIKKILPDHSNYRFRRGCSQTKTQNIAKRKVGFTNGTESENIFYTNTDQKVLQEIIGIDFIAISKDF
jgi:glutamate racemase